MGITDWKIPREGEIMSKQSGGFVVKWAGDRKGSFLSGEVLKEKIFFGLTKRYEIEDGSPIWKDNVIMFVAGSLLVLGLVALGFLI